MRRRLLAARRRGRRSDRVVVPTESRRVWAGWRGELVKESWIVQISGKMLIASSSTIVAR